jgi:hypothetical protein
MSPTLQVTYPLDTLRLRLAVDPSLRGVGAATVALLREGGAPAFYRGLGIALLGAAMTALMFQHRTMTLAPTLTFTVTLGWKLS